MNSDMFEKMNSIRYITVKREDTEKLRAYILKRDGFACRYCGTKKQPFEIDHVYPVVRGGETTEKNLVTACQDCNARKHSKVGIWPKPIGYFDEKKPVVSISNVFILSLSTACFANGFLNFYEDWVMVGKISLALGFVILNVGLLKISLGK